MMNFVSGLKNILSVKTSTSDDNNNSNSNNITTFTTTSVTQGNSFIITTSVPHHNQQKETSDSVIFQTTSALSPAEMTISPTESFHSASSSTFEQNNDKHIGGKTNNGYTGSTTEINNNHVQSHQRNQIVQQESYWTWEWPFRVFWASWNNREKIFLIVIVVLSISVLILVSLLAVTLTRNFQLRQVILSKLGADLSII